ncbi:hypothetical protein C8J57DRAFT_1280718 [Mycena rebaudengoi]|nr:hypothetical protein C8J57DRAFT_1280718 [Mycena rebaudengoi]
MNRKQIIRLHYFEASADFFFSAIRELHRQPAMSVLWCLEPEGPLPCSMVFCLLICLSGEGFFEARDLGTFLSVALRFSGATTSRICLEKVWRPSRIAPQTGNSCLKAKRYPRSASQSGQNGLAGGVREDVRFRRGPSRDRAALARETPRRKVRLSGWQWHR